MITKGIVEEVIDPYNIKVRLPIYNAISTAKDATPTKDLNTATICSISNSSNLVNVGDIVFVGFEDNDSGKPVILGHLFKENSSDTFIDMNLRMLSTNSTTRLNYNTYIGNITPKEISTLSGIKANIQEQIFNLDDKYVRLNSDSKILGQVDFVKTPTINGDNIALEKAIPTFSYDETTKTLTITT